jgi:hypothetical protein
MAILIASLTNKEPCCVLILLKSNVQYKFIVSTNQYYFYGATTCTHTNIECIMIIVCIDFLEQEFNINKRWHIANWNCF